MSQISSLNDSSGTIQSYSYLGLDTESGATYGNGVTLSISYDNFGRTSSLQYVQSGAGGSFEDDSYTYDADGNVLTHDGGSGGNQSYTYDDLNRLTNYNSSSGSSTGVSYSLNAAGDWNNSTTGTSGYDTTYTTTTRTNNAQNQATVVGGNTLTYDKNGNTTTDQTGQEYVYDAWNRLKTVKNSSGGTIAAYTYDALGRRITTAEGDVTTDNYFSNQSLIVQVSDSAFNQYIWGPFYVNQLIQEQIGSTKYYVDQDANWNVTSVTNTSGGEVEDYTTDPYGNITVYNGSGGVLGTGLAHSAIGQIFGFQCGWTDPITGLVHFQARDLNTGLGSWVEQDPRRYVNGPNVYQLELSNPVGRLDPAGTTVDSNGIYTWTDLNGNIHSGYWIDKGKNDQHFVEFPVVHSNNVNDRSQDMYGQAAAAQSAANQQQKQGMQKICQDNKNFERNEFLFAAAAAILGGALKMAGETGSTGGAPLQDRVEQAIQNELDARGDIYSDANYVEDLGSPHKVANLDPKLGPNQVRYQCSVVNDMTGETTNWSVNYDPDTGNFGTIKPASGRS
jgi:RHS repeat-associated protein